MSRASITKAHTKIQELSWDPTFVEPVDDYPTDWLRAASSSHHSCSPETSRC